MPAAGKRLHTSQDSSESVLRGPSPEWPAPVSKMTAARTFLRECASSSKSTLLVPDKDADGLSGTLIVYRTLLALGHPANRITLHFVTKGSNPHREDERERLAQHKAEYAIVVDQGSRPGPPLVRGAKTLLVDHHMSDDFPEDTLVVSACKHEPIATSATLAYILCKPLHSSVQQTCDYLCAVGTIGDLGTSFKWTPPFPEEDMKACFKKYTKKAVTEVVSLVNAPRRTATYDVEASWNALLHSRCPADITSPGSEASPEQRKHTARLRAARAEINAEVDRCSRGSGAKPTFSGDGRVALIRINSEAQVHPVVATRWTGRLKSTNLQIVMAANDGYTPGMTHFSCRVARDAGDVDIIALLKEYAARQDGLTEQMGHDFARGHKRASGGIVSVECFERLWEVMARSEGDEDQRDAKRRRKQVTNKTQANTLDGWVKKGV